MDQFAHFMTPRLYEIIGIAGFALYVINYTLLTFHAICARHVPYFVLNLTAATLVLISLSHSFNLASLLIQVFWIAISLVAITLRLSRKNAPATAS